MLIHIIKYYQFNIVDKIILMHVNANKHLIG